MFRIYIPTLILEQMAMSSLDLGLLALPWKPDSLIHNPTQLLASVCFILRCATCDAEWYVFIVITVKAFTIQDFLKLQSLSVCLFAEILTNLGDLMIVQNLFYLSFASGTGSDVLLALSLCFYLWKCRTGFERTNNLIQALMAYTINTSLLVA